MTTSNLDAFGNTVSDRTNVIDIAAHYPQSPERLRLFKNGTRQLRSYNSVPEYNHNWDIHELSPSAGDTITLRSAERPRYVVQYELAATWAFDINQALQSGDSIQVGLYDGTDGWYMEQTGTHEPDEADFVSERNGSEVYRRSDVNLRRPTTDFARNKLTTGWYNITRQKWERSYANAGDQQNPVVLSTSRPLDVRGPRYGNLPLWHSVTAGNGTNNLTLNAGSCAQVNLGTTTAQQRVKTSEHQYDFSTTGAWVPIWAFRKDPDRKITSAQLRTIRITEWDGQDDVKLAIQAHDPRNVEDGAGNQLTDTDFSTVDQHDPLNSVIEDSAAVGAAADDTGTVVSSTASYGGYQTGWDSFNTSGTGGQAKTFTSAQSSAKRQMYEDDVLVVWGYADNASEVHFETVTEQDW